MSASRSDSKFRSLEGLRGVAAMMVLLMHLQYAFCIDLPDRTRAALERVLGTSNFNLTLQWLLEAVIASLYDGGFAVWVFWVMSAVVLSRKFFELSLHRQSIETTQKNMCEPDAHQYLLESTIRRYPRLVIPVLASTLIAYLIHKNGWMLNQKVAADFGDSYRPWLGSFYSFAPHSADAVYGGVWQAFFQHNPNTTYNPLLWTIEKEMWGSLFLFASCALVGQFSHRWIIYIIATLVIWKIDMLWLNAFVSGMAISDLVVQWNSRGGVATLPKPYRNLCESKVVSLLLLLTIWVVVGLSNYGNISNWILACLLTLAAIILPPVGRALSSRFLQFLGAISFGMYLIHFPIMCSFSCWAYIQITPSLGNEIAIVFVTLATISCSIAGALLFTVLFDRPAIRFSKWLAERLFRPEKLTTPASAASSRDKLLSYITVLFPKTFEAKS